MSSFISRVVAISPGQGQGRALLEEDPQAIRESLEDAYALQEFSVLLCDQVGKSKSECDLRSSIQVSSQSGRILPLETVASFCEEHKIVLVVDGTQSCQLLLSSQKKAVLDRVDFFVMSTHKWIGNVKTCGLIRYFPF